MTSERSGTRGPMRIERVGPKVGFAVSQHGGTCYAHACASAIRMAKFRCGLEDGMESHDDIASRIIARHGDAGGHCTTVLQEELPMIGLHYQVMGLEAAEEAVRCDHAVILSFELDAARWAAFEKFFEENPYGVLGDQDLPEESWCGANSTGHATVIIAIKDDHWLVKNSWGPSFADDGCFRVRR